MTLIAHSTRRNRLERRRPCPKYNGCTAQRGRPFCGPPWRVPEHLNGFDWVSSPLSAVETASILSGRALSRLDDRLEMDWAAWKA